MGNILEKVFEVCPICEQKVELPTKKGYHICPVCGNLITACDMCNTDDVDCSDCEFKKR